MKQGRAGTIAGGGQVHRRCIHANEDAGAIKQVGQFALAPRQWPAKGYWHG